jgi:hypothetical protein
MSACYDYSILGNSQDAETGFFGKAHSRQAYFSRTKMIKNTSIHFYFLTEVYVCLDRINTLYKDQPPNNSKGNMKLLNVAF